MNSYRASSGWQQSSQPWASPAFGRALETTRQGCRGSERNKQSGILTVPLKVLMSFSRRKSSVSSHLICFARARNPPSVTRLCLRHAWSNKEFELEMAGMMAHSIPGRADGSHVTLRWDPSCPVCKAPARSHLYCDARALAREDFFRCRGPLSAVDAARLARAKVSLNSCETVIFHGQSLKGFMHNSTICRATPTCGRPRPLSTSTALHTPSATAPFEGRTRWMPSSSQRPTARLPGVLTCTTAGRGVVVGVPELQASLHVLLATGLPLTAGWVLDYIAAFTD